MPVAILISVFLVMGIVITTFITSNLQKVESSQLRRLLASEKKQLSTGLRLVATSALPADAYLGLEGEDDVLALDLAKQVGQMEFDETFITDLQGETLFSTSEADMPEEVVEAIRGSVSAEGAVHVSNIGNMMVGFAPIFDVETPKGFLVVMMKIPDGFQKVAENVFKEGASQSSDALKASQEMEQERSMLLANSKSFLNRMHLTASVTVFVSLLLVGVTLGTSSRNILKRIKATVDRLKDIAEGEGDLTIRIEVKSQDEIGDLAHWFNKFVASLQEIIGIIKENVEEVSASSSQLSATADSMQQGAESQDAQTEQVATSMEEMSQTILDVAKNASDADEMSKNASKNAEEGNQIVDSTVDGMNNLANIVKETAEIINGLGTRSTQIGEIVGVINDIADQTNLLALNAAIEAARAGEQGRGFAVVADEVRKLAERTSRATGEISDMIAKIQSETQQSVSVMETSRTSVEKEVVMAGEAKKVLSRIVEDSNTSSDMIQRIAASTEEQSASTAEVSENMEKILRTTKDSTSAISQVATASEKLRSMADSLKERIGIFKV
jgi:methyl-accepting chemotaxis protein